NDASEDGDVLVVAVAALQDLADVPVAGMKDLHSPSPLGTFERRPAPRTVAGRRRRQGWWRMGQRAWRGRCRGLPIPPSRSGGSPTRGTGSQPLAGQGYQAGR